MYNNIEVQWFSVIFSPLTKLFITVSYLYFQSLKWTGMYSIITFGILTDIFYCLELA